MMRMKPPPFQWIACLHRLKEAFVQNLKERSDITLRLWTEQCEFILAQRFRRGQQIATFYRRIWDQHKLLQLLYGYRRQLFRCGIIYFITIRRNFNCVLLASAALYGFDWEKERISYDTIRPHFDDIDFVRQLRKETLICITCNKRKKFGEQFEDQSYCMCPNKSDEIVISKSGWEPYIERKNMLIWRREEKPSRYAYKVYCVYDDITASDFLQVQVDLEYRKIWDDTAAVLDVVENDPFDAARSQIIYWEMRWPALFANRDYVYSRRIFINKVKNVIVICSKSTKHPKCPVEADKHRVHDYWSFMVVKPFKSINDPGLEFVLTYFDDPGVSLPSYITNWVAQKQMPEFLNKLYLATKEFYNCKKFSRKTTYSWEQIKVIDEGKYRRQSAEVNTADSEGPHQVESISMPSSTDENLNTDSENKRSWWSYLYPTHYFA